MCVLEFNNNLILQYGKATTENAVWSVIFPLSYTTKNVVTLGPYQTSDGANFTLSEISLTHFKGWYGGWKNGNMYWIAIGY